MAAQFIKSSTFPAGATQIVNGLKPYALAPLPITIMHYGLLRGWREYLCEFGFKIVVFDEIQELRHTGTEKYSVASLIGEKMEKTVGLSGTPIYGYGAEIWAIMNILEYHCLGDFESFTREWCCGYGDRTIRDPNALGSYLKREGLMLRRRKSDVLSELPPKRRIIVAIDKDDDVYRKLISHAVGIANRYHLIQDWSERGQAMRETMRLARQAAGIAKAGYVAAFVASLLDAGERVLLYSYHHAVHNIAAKHLSKWGPVRVSGEETPKEKDEAVRAFRDGKTPLIQLSLRSTAGLDGLQGAGTCVVFGELDWSPAVHSQAEDRIHRIGIREIESLLCYYLVSNTGFDETIQEALGLKIGQFVGLMGDALPSEEDRALAGQAAEIHLQKIIESLRTVNPGKRAYRARKKNCGTKSAEAPEPAAV